MSDKRPSADVQAWLRLVKAHKDASGKFVCLSGNMRVPAPIASKAQARGEILRSVGVATSR